MTRTPRPASADGSDSPPYLRHIDGIRALAILPVLAFHATPELCPGGYAGVDVFFVVSGYLITSQIVDDLSRGRFSFGGFYDRRIRRILPALWAVIAATLVSGAAILHARRLLSLAEAAFAATLYSANLYFLAASRGYFAADDVENPLLHLWSLGVEEQFYVFFPVLCVFVSRWRPGFLRPLLGILAGLSLYSATVLVHAGRTDEAFYRLPFRAWEFLAGGLLATSLPIEAIDRRIRARSDGDESDGSDRILAPLGLALVFLSIAVLSPTSPFPGARALPVVVGTVLLLRSGHDGPVARVLCSRPFRWIGILSYGLYLWHWPVLVFARLVTWDRLGLLGTLSAVGASFLAAALSRRWIETPLRRRPATAPTDSFRMAAMGTALLAGACLACIFARGWPRLLHPEASKLDPARHFLVESEVRRVACRLKRLVTGRVGIAPPPGDACFVPEPGFYHRGGVTHFGRPERTDLVVVGDSHAVGLISGLDQVFNERGLGGVAVARHGANVFDSRSPDYPTVERVIAGAPDARTVLLTEYWLSPRNRGVDITQPLVEFCESVRRSGHRLLLATDVPRWNLPPAGMAAQAVITPPPDGLRDSIGFQSDADYASDQGAWNLHLAEVAEQTGAVILPLHLAFRRGNGFVAFEPLGSPSTIFYFDRTHLTHEGSLVAARYIADQTGFSGSGEEPSAGDRRTPTGTSP